MAVGGIYLITALGGAAVIEGMTLTAAMAAIATFMGPIGWAIFGAIVIAA